jgi:hypothetical protein
MVLYRPEMGRWQRSSSAKNEQQVRKELAAGPDSAVAEYAPEQDEDACLSGRQDQLNLFGE